MTVPPPAPLSLEWATNASALADSARSQDIGQTIAAQSHDAAAPNLERPHSFGTLCHAAKIRALHLANQSEEAPSRSPNTGSQLNTIRQVQLFLRSVAAGIQCWASFFDLIGCPYFHPLSENVIRRSACFNPGKPFALFLSHVGEACQLPNLPPAWYTAAVRGVARGLEFAQDFSLSLETTS